MLLLMLLVAAATAVVAVVVVDVVDAVPLATIVAANNIDDAVAYVRLSLLMLLMSVYALQSRWE